MYPRDTHVDPKFFFYLAAIMSVIEIWGTPDFAAPNVISRLLRTQTQRLILFRFCIWSASEWCTPFFAGFCCCFALIVALPWPFQFTISQSVNEVFQKLLWLSFSSVPPWTVYWTRLCGIGICSTETSVTRSLFFTYQRNLRPGEA